MTMDCCGLCKQTLIDKVNFLDCSYALCCSSVIRFCLSNKSLIFFEIDL